MKKPRRILAFATLVLLIGISVAYYNTSSFGYDNANIISISDEEIRLMDVRIKYKEIEKKFEIVKENMPSDFITV
jgi:TPP-dependent 2-oxoacid decarboxylase